MNIGFIGSGRVATHLALKLSQQHLILQVYSPNEVHAEKLALQVQAKVLRDLSFLRRDLDLLIICVSDQAISSVVEQLVPLNFNGLILHTSGSTDIQVLSKELARVGVFYPLQTFSFNCEIDWVNTPLLIEANNKSDLYLLTDLANHISSKVYQYSSEQRMSLHLAAVFACNFSNYCYDMAKQITDVEHVDFSLLYPLIRATAEKAILNDPKTVQTGPAIRGDQHILNMHQQILVKNNQRDLMKIYDLLSEAIKNNRNLA